MIHQIWVPGYLGRDERWDRADPCQGRQWTGCRGDSCLPNRELTGCWPLAAVHDHLAAPTSNNRRLMTGASSSTARRQPALAVHIRFPGHLLQAACRMPRRRPFEEVSKRTLYLSCRVVPASPIFHPRNAAPYRADPCSGQSSTTTIKLFLDPPRRILARTQRDSPHWLALHVPPRGRTCHTDRGIQSGSWIVHAATRTAGTDPIYCLHSSHSIESTRLTNGPSTRHW